MTRLASLLVVSFAVLACTPTKSSSVPTSQLQARIDVVADGSGQTVVSTWLLSHPPNAPVLNFDSIELVDGDQLTATSNGTSLAMQEEFTPVVGEYTYRATFASADVGEAFAVTLERTTGQSAGASTVSLPAPFAVAAPASPSRSQPIVVTWAPSGTTDAIKISITGCGDAELGPLADSGVATIAAGMLTSPTAACAATLTVTRQRAGALDSAYGQGGSITASQQRTAAITTTP